MGSARPGQFIVSWWCTWQGHGVHVCWGTGCVLRSRGWLAMSTRQVFVVVYAESGKKTEYLPEPLAEVLAETGLVCVAVCSGGAALCNPGDGGTYFKQVLA